MVSERPTAVTTSLPRLLITMGDVAGIGPEIIARTWPGLLPLCQPIVVGDPSWLNWALTLAGVAANVQEVSDLEAARPAIDRLPCLPGSGADLRKVVPGQVCAAAGLAAYEFLCTAIDRTMAGEANGIVTAPLHKEGLRAAGLSYPGHTEILAERTGTAHFGMMLFGHGMGVVHVTLHMALRNVFAQLEPEAVIEKIRLLAEILPRLQGRAAALASPRSIHTPAMAVFSATRKNALFGLRWSRRRATESTLAALGLRTRSS